MKPIRFLTSLIAFASYATATMAVNVQIDGYAAFSSVGDTKFNNVSSVNISGNVRSQANKVTFNNVSSINVTGNVTGAGQVKFNNASGTVTGYAQSQSSVSVTRNVRVTGGTSVVSSIGSQAIIQLSAPSGTSDPSYLTPITIITGDYSINGSVTLAGTIYATGAIHINNGATVSGTGSLVAGGDIHINNVSNVGSSGTKTFLYSLNGDVHINNVSSFALKGGIYSPNGKVMLNNVSSVNIAGGVFGEEVDFNNISSLTLGPGSYNSGATPPGIDPTIVISNPCSACGTSGGDFATCISSACGYVVH